VDNFVDLKEADVFNKTVFALDAFNETVFALDAFNETVFALDAFNKTVSQVSNCYFGACSKLAKNLELNNKKGFRCNKIQAIYFSS